MEGKGKKYTLSGKKLLLISGRRSCILFTVCNLSIFNVNIFKISEIGPEILQDRQQQGSG
jgi:hypothetical protein